MVLISVVKRATQEGKIEEFVKTRVRNWVSKQGITYSRKLKAHYTNKLWAQI